jgi:putative ABC transport system ATP-binding protein
MPLSIELRNIGKTFREGSGSEARERVVLRGANLSIASGEAVVLIGRSGSGKSTLLNILGGLDAPSVGDVLVEGTSLGALSEKERTLFRRRRIGFVFQNFNLIPTLTVEENLLLPQELKDGVTGEGRRRALDLLDEVGLRDRSGSFPDVLSGGEQQRVAVARALSHDPAIILADEPTGNLDAETGLQVMAILERLIRRAGKTLVMVTHSPELAGFADRFVSMRNGALESARPPSARFPE